MARLDIGEALGEGFRLIRRRPFDCLVWGVTYFVLAFLPVIAIVAWVMPQFMHDMQAATANGHVPTAQEMMVAQLRIQAVQPLIWIGSLVGRSVVYSAVFRAVLTPTDRGFFSMKFGPAELWVGLVLLVQMVCTFLVIMALVLVSVMFWIPTFAAIARHSLAGWEIPLGLLSALAAGVVFLWLFVRFSMAAPMSFAERQFRLFESWSMTRGQGLGLFALYLVTAIMVWCILVVVEGVLFGICAAVFFGGGLHKLVDLEAMRDPATIFQTMAPVILGVAGVASLVGGYFMALMMAPWAKAYAQLSGRADVAATA